MRTAGTVKQKEKLKRDVAFVKQEGKVRGRWCWWRKEKGRREGQEIHEWTDRPRR